MDDALGEQETVLAGMDQIESLEIQMLLAAESVGAWRGLHRRHPQ